MSTPVKGKRHFKPIEPYGEQYERLANQLARSYAPDIRPCRICKHPVLSGYCCGTCGSSSP